MLGQFDPSPVCIGGVCLTWVFVIGAASLVLFLLGLVIFGPVLSRRSASNPRSPPRRQAASRGAASSSSASWSSSSAPRS
jgi:hypothetical protein